jgi:hypothetical protein
MSRFSFTPCVVALSFLASISGARAQTEPRANAVQPVQPVVAPSILSVPLPPNARLRFDLDAQDEDVLGVTKSLLRGFNGFSVKEILGLTGSIGGPQKTLPTGPTSDLNTAASLAMVSDADLKTMLEDVHHLRVVFFETPRSYSNRNKMVATSQSVFSYYRAAYLTREGGRQVLRADFDDVQMLGVGFPNRGFALVLQGPGMGAVLRCDGYPNLESVGPLAMAAFLRFAPPARG